jgi:hypothetical protein
MASTPGRRRAASTAAGRNSMGGWERLAKHLDPLPYVSDGTSDLEGTDHAGRSLHRIRELRPSATPFTAAPALTSASGRAVSTARAARAPSG